jgi:hypothetical protein
MIRIGRIITPCLRVLFKGCIVINGCCDNARFSGEIALTGSRRHLHPPLLQCMCKRVCMLVYVCVCCDGAVAADRGEVAKAPPDSKGKCTIM